MQVASNADGSFNMQCDMAAEGGEGDSSSRSTPLYCSFIPFFSYSRK